jgi:DNA-binding XRE family transcriptional regulator
MAEDYDTLGRRLRTVRLGLGLDQQVVSKALGIAPTVISKHEHDRRNVSEEAALRYAKYYGIPVEHLLDAPKEKRPPKDVDVIPRFQGEPKSRGERLERLRQSRGFMKLAPTARMIGINPTTMTHHEKGLREITRQAAELYARFFPRPGWFHSVR